MHYLICAEIQIYSVSLNSCILSYCLCIMIYIDSFRILNFYSGTLHAFLFVQHCLYVSGLF